MTHPSILQPVSLRAGLALILAVWFVASSQNPFALGEPAPVLIQEVAAPPVEPEDEVEAPTRPADGLLPTDRAWEYSHYRVRIWICTDGSIASNSLLTGFADEIRNNADLCDPSAWELLPVNAPIQWRWKCLNGIHDPAKSLKDIGLSPELGFDDKLMIVNFVQRTSGVLCQVRELDLTTNQWGALVEQTVEQTGQAGDIAFSMIRTAFMPLARIDRVTEQNEVYMRVKGANLCHAVVFSPEQQSWTVVLNTGSPVMVQANDFLIPVLRKTDRDNKLLSQDPVELTYIQVDPAGPPKESEKPAVGESGSGETAPADPAATDPATAGTSPNESPEAETPAAETPAGETAVKSSEQDQGESEILGKNLADLFGRVQSSFRAPLVARKSKRLEKLALVIRPPGGTTVLKLIAADASKQPMEGIEIWSHPLNASVDEGWEKLGKTDWRGMLDIPPSPEGLRMIYIKRGARSLRKLPVMPGLYSQVETTIVNDEARLFSEGVIAGLGNEILDVLAQRTIFEKLIADYLEGDDPSKETIDMASDELKKYSELPKFQQLRARLSDEKSRLQAQSSDKREEEFINKMFDTLESLLTKYLGNSRESELRQRIQTLQMPNDAAGAAADAAADDAG